MVVTKSESARGTATLVFSQGCYFALGYLAVVLLAREFGPATYGAYGVIMSVLVWLEESGRYAVPSATAKLLAESPSGSEELERTALTLNLGLYALLFVLLWAMAPSFASWFGIANGTFLIRLAAIDLPFFGVYTACRAIHQGHRRFFRLGASQIMYAFTKLLGVLLLIVFDLSLESALLFNVAATVVGLGVVLPGTGLRWQWMGVERVAPLLSEAGPMGLYYFVLELRNSVLLWTLQIMSQAWDERIVGIFVAALNIARVPSMALATVTVVLLPTLSRAIAVNDGDLARRYINQALRFGLILYLPVCLVLTAQPEKLMQWIYSKDFSGGGIVLSILVLGEGLRVVHAILGAVLNAAGAARKAAIFSILSLAPFLAILVLLIYLWGGIGAALASVFITVVMTLIFSIVVWKRFGTLMAMRSARNIGLAGGLMLLVFVLFPESGGFFIAPYAASLAAYFAALVGLREVTRQDFAAFVPGMRVRPYQVPNR